MEGIDGRLDEEQHQISNVEDKTTVRVQAQHQQEKRILNNGESLRNLWDIKHNNIHITGLPEGEESEQGIENLLEEIITKNFPKLVKEKVTQVQEAPESANQEHKVAHTNTHHN